MKLTTVFVTFSLFLLCVFITASNAEPNTLEKRSAGSPYERALARRMMEQLESVQGELSEPKTRVARAADTEVEKGDGSTGFFSKILGLLLWIPRSILVIARSITAVVGQKVICGVINGIVGIIDKAIEKLKGS